MNQLPIPVSISGMGCVSCVGVGPEILFDRVYSEQSGISDGLGKIPESLIHNIKQTERLKPSDSLSLVLAYTSAIQSMKQAGWSELCDDDGLIIATTTGQIDLWEEPLMSFMQKKINAQQFAPYLHTQPLGSLTTALSKCLGFHGKTILISSACSAATQGLALARSWIQNGHVKRCLVGGVEVLSRLTIDGFRSLQLLTNTPATPFDSERKGINLAEGAGFLCIEQSPKTNLAYISGAGTTSDAFHMTSPEPHGRGSFEAMKLALIDARLEPQDIDWVHAHGTGSKANDSAEGNSINELFGMQPWVSSTKNIHGHTLGASGAIEAILCVQALNKQVVLKTSGLKNSDVSVKHPEQHLNVQIKHILKNTLGFGGNNAALILSHSSQKDFGS